MGYVQDCLECGEQYHPGTVVEPEERLCQRCAAKVLKQRDELRDLCLLVLNEGEDNGHTWYVPPKFMHKLCACLGHSWQDGSCGNCGLCAGEHDWDENQHRKRCKKCWHVERAEAQ